MIEVVVLILVLVASVCVIGRTVHTLKPIKNKDWETKKREMAKLFGDASSHIEIVTDLAREFFASPPILESLEKAAKRGVQIRVVYDPNGYKLNEVKELQKLVEAGLVKAVEAKQAFTKENDRHVMEIDGTWARLETYHPAKQMVEGEAQARIYQSPAIARFVEERFNRRWEQAISHSDNGVGD
jgi:phosphatidylserine/phosphatidylglycerophosphate/cardiolipin synthase-like enzyme